MLNILDEAKKQGRVEGNIEGAYKKSVTLLTRMIEKKLGALPESLKSAIESSNVTVLDSLIEDMTIIETFEDVEKRLKSKQ